MPPEPSPTPDHPLDRAGLLAGLRARVARLDRGGPRWEDRNVLPIAPELDAHLPWGGLPLAGLHEIMGEDFGAIVGFSSILLARAQAALHGRSLLWIAAEPDAYPPGLATLGLDAARLILVRAPRQADALWAAEEALRSPAIAAVLLLGTAPNLTETRRLQLAAETGGGIGLLLRETAEEGGPGAALTRWRVAPATAAAATPHHLGEPAWELALLRARGGRPGAWFAEWNPAQSRLWVPAARPLTEPNRKRA